MTNSQDIPQTDPQADLFEGPEKKCEISINPSCESLRKRDIATWKKLVEKANAKILSQCSNDVMDAYLLSESSLFVYEHKIILITCGKTTLVDAALFFMNEISVKDTIESLYFERKNSHFPEDQPSTFAEDAAIMKEHLGGESFRFGHLDEHHIFLHTFEKSKQCDSTDRTTELLMHGIRDEAADLFDASKSSGEKIEKIFYEGLGWRELFTDLKLDSFLFEPYGYSMNALSGSFYFTIHITPQQTGSYVSFESNCNDTEKLQKLNQRVLDFFKPRAFDVFKFTPASLVKNTLCEQRFSFSKHQKLVRNFRQSLDSGFQVDFNHYVDIETTSESAHKL